MTDSEQLLWSRIRRKQLCGIQFYRQKPIGSYIVDFYAPKAELVIEVDGSQHLNHHHSKDDAVRDAELAKQGLRVMRFHNLQVLNELESILEAIIRCIQEIPPSPPLTKGGGGGILTKGRRGDLKRGKFANERTGKNSGC